jgi:hypothetical protein
MLGYIDKTASTGIQAACFGAVKGHPYIKKCMEYCEKNQLFPESEFSAIMKLERSKRFNYIRPIVAPNLYDSTLKNYFSNENYRIYPSDYFCARNLITGEIQKTKNTFAVDYSASAYISPAALKRREIYRFIAKSFGENHFITRMILRLRDTIWRIGGVKLRFK